MDRRRKLARFFVVRGKTADGKEADRGRNKRETIWREDERGESAEGIRGRLRVKKSDMERGNNR